MLLILAKVILAAAPVSESEYSIELESSSSQPLVTSGAGAGIGTSYCRSAANSISAEGSRISATGSVHLGERDVVLHADNAPVGATAFFFYGMYPVEVPFGDGVRCIGGPLTTLPPVPNSGGSFVHAVDLASNGSALASIASVRFQRLYRDGANGGFGFNLTDGLLVEFTY